jgi:hypothetical protein
MEQPILRNGAPVELHVSFAAAIFFYHHSVTTCDRIHPMGSSSL